MSDDKSKRGPQDRAQVAADEPYEVRFFAAKHGISRDEAEAILAKVGPDRRRADAMAEGKRQ